MKPLIAPPVALAAAGALGALDSPTAVVAAAGAALFAVLAGVALIVTAVKGRTRLDLRIGSGSPHPDGSPPPADELEQLDELEAEREGTYHRARPGTDQQLDERTPPGRRQASLRPQHRRR